MILEKKQEFDMAESKHAQKLRELGFAYNAGPGIIQGSRAERRAAKKKKIEPFFTVSVIGTLATDETGQQWLCPTETDDLLSLGFKDNTPPKEFYEHVR